MKILIVNESVNYSAVVIKDENGKLIIYNPIPEEIRKYISRINYVDKI